MANSKNSNGRNKKGQTKAGRCHCGCGNEVKRSFKQGHDAKLYGRARKLADGRMKFSELRGLGVARYAYPYYREAQAEFAA